MEIRGRRECRDCGERWSYYETGQITCPACGSAVSVGVDERTRHTDAPVELDLSPYRDRLADAGLDAVADDLDAALREYVTRRGFIREGELRDLDGVFLAACELRHALDAHDRQQTHGDAARLYVLDLVGGAESGERPAAEAVPASMASARALGVADALGRYRRELLTYLDDHPDPAARRVLGSVAERVTRIEALDGDVPPATARALVAATRDVARALQGEGETALDAARRGLGRLD